MEVNREYKDSVFTLLFNDKARLLELYNAINGTNFTEKDGIEINTLQNALFMGRVNDISFILADVLVVLIEHQSTINPNMPLRLLLYVAQIYQKIIDNKRLYASRKMDIPRPVFIALYIGKEDFPARAVLKLSDLFKEAAGHDKAALEVEVTVYNINKGVNPDIEGRSPALSGYAELVDKARKNEASGLERNEAVKQAVNFCVEHGILAGFLKEHGSEVENMLLTGWNWDDALQVRWEEGWKEGEEKAEKWFSELVSNAKTLEDLKRLMETPLSSKL
jgi:hypothetical protein